MQRHDDRMTSRLVDCVVSEDQAFMSQLDMAILCHFVGDCVEDVLGIELLM